MYFKSVYKFGDIKSTRETPVVSIFGFEWLIWILSYVLRWSMMQIDFQKIVHVFQNLK